MTKSEHYARMRAAKAAKREALGSVATLECGRVEFYGSVFGGRHTVVLSCREDEPRRMMLSVDGKFACAKTQRGVRALVARKIASKLCA